MDEKKRAKRARNKELREFALIMAIGITLIFSGLFPWLAERPIPSWPVISGVVLLVVAIIMPIALFPLHWLWMKIGAVLGWINTRILLTIIFYLIFMPVGLIMRLFGNDPMRRRLDPDAESYRILSKPIPPEKLERPF